MLPEGRSLGEEVHMSQPEPVAAILERWMKRAEEWKRLDVSVNGSALAEEVIRDLEAATASSDETMNLTQAAALSGYSADHLGRMVRDGTLQNHGKRGSPRVRRSELPAKPALSRQG